MATKKQKRERAEAKHKHFMEELARSNAAALKKEQEHREYLKQKAEEEARERKIAKSRKLAAIAAAKKLHGASNNV